MTGTAGASAIYETSAGPVFRITCGEPGRLGLAIPGGEGGAIAIRTSFGERTITASPLPAVDPLFDQMAFSRGRFLVRAAGVPDLVLPTWPEPARVIEECRRP